MQQYEYAGIMMASILTAVWLSRRNQQNLGLTTPQKWGIRYGAFVGSMIGAKLPFLVTNPQGLMNLSAWTETGKTIVFGLAFGYLGVELAKYILNVKVKTGDSFAVPVSAGIAIGRWSCFVGGCCYGKPTNLPWGVNFGDGVMRHPTQIYEFMFHLLAAMTLAWLYRLGKFRGQLIKLYILSYLCYRFLTEFLRPEPVVAGGLTFYQWSTLALLPVFLCLWWWDSKNMANREQIDSKNGSTWTQTMID